MWHLCAHELWNFPHKVLDALSMLAGHSCSLADSPKIFITPHSATNLKRSRKFVADQRLVSRIR